MTHSEQIIQAIQTVYDPEFPLIDIYTMGLVYDIKCDETSHAIIITMTLTTPACPAADYIPMATKNAVQDVFPEYEISTVMTFEPSWTIEMIKDDDFKKLFSIDG